ncbi:MAG: MarC family protein [Bacteroidales bacterium]|jgi:multiple antibiotic resistance protein|nr:MarC family protein [Bacteroidales bacterium]
MGDFNFREMVSAFIVLFAVIDILGSVPIIIDIRDKGGRISAWQAAPVSFGILIAFLFLGEALLGLFGVDLSSFAIAGSFILMIMAIEMILGVHIFKHDSPAGASIVPVAFPLVAGAGSFTTLLALRAEFALSSIIVALFLNILLVFFVLHYTDNIKKIVGGGGVYVMKKFFGIILMAMSIRLFMSNFASLLVDLLTQLKAL